MFDTIVVGVDGSDHSYKAVEYAVDIARLAGSTLLLLTAFRPIRMPDSSHSMVRPQLHPDPADTRMFEKAREVVEAADVVGSTSTICETVADADPGETWAIGTEIHLAEHLDRWYPEVEVVPLCGDACMDCNAMRQVDPNYLTWILEELVAGREQNVVSVPERESELAGLAMERMLEL